MRNPGISRSLTEGMTGGNPSYGHLLPVGGTRRNLSDVNVRGKSFVVEK